MTNCVLILVAVLALPLLGQVSAQDESAVNVQSSCAHWSKLRLDKHKQFRGDSDDLYQTGLCVGYFSGLMDGMNDTGGWKSSDGTFNFFQINRSAINSEWDVIRAFYAYLDANPLAKGKPAWSVLQGVLLENGLAKFVPQEPQAHASALSNECKTGATNVITQFKSDNELKIVDTPTLVSVNSSLSECLETKGLTDSDSALLLEAQSKAGIVLLVRAMNVLDRHGLLRELRAEASPSSQKSTLSRVPSGKPEEQ
jgi:hypothetical protein